MNKEKIRIKAEHKALTNFNFATIKFNKKFQRVSQKRNKKYIDWQKSRKCGCKYLADQTCKHINKKYKKYYQKKHIS